jgi:hypothetical protein
MESSEEELNNPRTAPPQKNSLGAEVIRKTIDELSTREESFELVQYRNSVAGSDRKISTSGDTRQIVELEKDLEEEEEEEEQADTVATAGTVLTDSPGMEVQHAAEE